MKKIQYPQYYATHIQPLLDQPWIRADTRRVFHRMSMMTPRHRIHLKTYAEMRDRDSLQTRARDLVVIPTMVGKKVGIYDGRKYVVTLIMDRHVGYRLGELAYPKIALHKHTSKTRVKNVKK